MARNHRWDERAEATQRVLDEWMERCDQMVMREKMIQATKTKLLALEKQYDGVKFPIEVKQEIARLKAMITKLEREYEVKP